MTYKTTPEKALEAARVLLGPWVSAIAGDGNGDNYCYSQYPTIDQDSDDWSFADGGSQEYIGTDNIDWGDRPASERIVTADIVPTDEDACRRVKVVVKNHHYEDWSEPLTLLAVVDGPHSKFIVSGNSGVVVHRNRARLARPDEIKAAEVAK